jgi:hypothetical protein
VVGWRASVLDHNGMMVERAHALIEHSIRADGR